MSIKVMTTVWADAPYQGGALLILLSMADWADDNGYCWPSVRTLAKKSRQSERNVRKCLARMKEDGAVSVEPNAGPHGVNRYQIKFRQFKDCGNQKRAALSSGVNAVQSEKCGTSPLSSVPTGGERGSPNTSVDTLVEPSVTRRSVLVADLYRRYPKKVGKAEAFKAIGNAIVAVAKAGATDTHPDFVGDEQAAAQWLGSRVDLYAQSAQARQPDRSKVPYPASWFNAGRYDDDTTQWEYVGFENGSRGQQQTPFVAQRPADERLKDQLARYRAEHQGQEGVQP